MQALSIAPVATREAFAILFWIAAVALFVALAMRGVEGCEWLHRTLFAVGSVWLVFILYMTLATTPIVVLRDSVAALDSKVAIIGRDDRMNCRHKSIEELATQAPDTHFTILLDHQPYDIAASERLGIDLSRL